MKYNIYLIFENKKNDFFSNFLKNFIIFIIKWNCYILNIIDYGNIIGFKKKYERLFEINIFCSKNIIMKIFKLLRIKKKILMFYIILKRSINLYLFFFNFKKFLSKNFFFLPCYINKIKFKFYKIIVKNIKILKMMSIIPDNITKYLNIFNNVK